MRSNFRDFSVIFRYYLSTEFHILPAVLFIKKKQRRRKMVLCGFQCTAEKVQFDKGEIKRKEGS